MRIIAGTAKGRTLKVPRNAELRPTADRVKETIFNVLGQWLEGETVLDLFAGVGALGLEALSRGAQRATFVEKDKSAITVIAENARDLGFAQQSVTLMKPVDRAIRWLDGQAQTFSLVFADPPYAAEVVGATLRELDASNVVGEQGRVVMEHSRYEEAPERVGRLERVDQRRFGDTIVSFYVRRSAEAS